MRNSLNIIFFSVIGIFIDAANSKFQYPEECSDQLEKCYDNPIVDDIDIDDDDWKSEFKPSFLFNPDTDDDNGLDSFPDYTTPSWLTPPPGTEMYNYCYFRDIDNTTYICQSTDLLDLEQIFIKQNLQFLKINGTGIRKIPDDVFQNHTITVLIIYDDLKMNKMSRKSFRGLDGLNYLYINGNGIMR